MTKPTKFKTSMKLTEISVDTTIEVNGMDVDVCVDVPLMSFLKAIDDPDQLKGLGYLKIPKNISLLDEMKLEIFISILEKCTLDQLEEFKNNI